MKKAVVLAFLLPALSACKNDQSHATTCDPPSLEPLGEGTFANPLELALPNDCVQGGLDALPGRWFVVDRSSAFNYEYPKFEGSCESGFRRANTRKDDLDASDGRTSETWTDGTRLWLRDRRVRGDHEIVSAVAYCMTSDDTLGASYGYSDNEKGRWTWSADGEPFGRMDEPQSEGLALVGELGKRPDGSSIGALDVEVDDGIAYVAGLEGLDVVDVHDPSDPVHLALVPEQNSPGCNGVRVVRGAGKVVAFCAPFDGEQVLAFDVTDPESPVELAPIPEYAHTLFVRQDGDRTLMYLASYEDYVPVYDVTSPTAPVRLGAPVVGSEGGGIHDMFVDGDVIYAADTTKGFVVADVSAGLDQPAVRKAQIDTSYAHACWVATIGGRKIVIQGDEGITEDGAAFMRILDGDPSSPTLLTELARYRTRPEVSIHNMVIAGSLAYVSYYLDGVRVVDLSDPTHPREIAHYDTWDDETAPGDTFDGAVGIRFQDDLVWVADDLRGLIVLRPDASALP